MEKHIMRGLLAMACESDPWETMREIFFGSACGHCACARELSISVSQVRSIYAYSKLHTQLRVRVDGKCTIDEARVLLQSSHRQEFPTFGEVTVGPLSVESNSLRYILDKNSTIEDNFEETNIFIEIDLVEDASNARRQHKFEGTSMLKSHVEEKGMENDGSVCPQQEMVHPHTRIASSKQDYLNQQVSRPPDIFRRHPSSLASPGKGDVNTPPLENQLLSSARTLSGSERNQLKLLTSADRRDNIYLLPTGEFIHVHDILEVLQGRWMNSVVVNAYLTLLKMRNERQCGRDANSRGKSISMHNFDSYFYTKLKNSGCAGVRNWTKSLDIFRFDLLLFPINLQDDHWSLVAVHISTRRIEYYDSLNLKSRARLYGSIMDAIVAYIDDTAAFRGLPPLQWHQEVMRVPQQDGGTCGIYICSFADLLAKGSSLPFPDFEKGIADLQLGIAADVLRGFVS